MQLWRRCHELVWGADLRATWRRVEWPELGTVLDQAEILVELFEIVSDEKAMLLRGDLKRLAGG